MLGLSLGRSRSRDDAARESSDDFKSRLALRLRLTNDDSLAAMEIACVDPACPAEVETIILVMRKGEKTQAFKILKRIAEIEEADIETLADEAAATASDAP